MLNRMEISLLSLPRFVNKDYALLDTAGVAKMNCPLKCYFGNSLIENAVVEDQEKHTLTNWLPIQRAPYEDLANLKDDRDRWKELINESRASSTWYDDDVPEFIRMVQRGDCRQIFLGKERVKE